MCGRPAEGMGSAALDGGGERIRGGRPVIGFLGPEGTFTHQGARLLHGTAADLRADGSIPAVIAGVAEGRYDFGVVPIENTVEGIVTASLDGIVFRADPVLIMREASVRITFDAYVSVAADTPPTAVGSHPHGLAQCTRYVSRTGLPVEHFPSTAAAVRAAAERPGLIAIGAPGLDEAYPVRVHGRAVEDHPGAYTRFVCLGLAGGSEPLAVDADGLTWKTSVALTPGWSRPGALAELCTQFADRGIDIVSLASRPLPGFAGRYVFVVTVDHDRRSANLARAIRSLMHQGIRVKHLGSYLSDHTTAGVDARRALVPPPGSLGLAHLDEITQVFPGSLRAV
ncbi:prephenate dehydratase [Micromonospora peucetia]|uniref:Prephenate dehydratase n=1 Tax=Micromonospora peucetia TaxID=47871 RepID=A0A1C6VD51_9ACTN|nr:prephenate dehydratase [Micromonospora peucetia]